MVQLYKTFVRPHLEYAVQAWCPYTIKDIDTLEKVQKRFMRQITSLSGTYEEKLLKIGLTSLKDRRTRGDCIETFKMLRGFTKVDKSTWLTLLSRDVGPQTRLSSDPLSLETKPARLDLRKHFFSIRIPLSGMPSRFQFANQPPLINSKLCMTNSKKIYLPEIKKEKRKKKGKI